MDTPVSKLPSAVQIVTSVEIYQRGNVISLHYEGTQDAMYKYPGAIFGVSAYLVRRALTSGAAVPFPNGLNIQKTV
jgi:hypothetical protein